MKTTKKFKKVHDLYIVYMLIRQSISTNKINKNLKPNINLLFRLRLLIGTKFKNILFF